MRLQEMAQKMMKFTAPLDKGFVPAIFFEKCYRDQIRPEEEQRFSFCLERGEGQSTTFETTVSSSPELKEETEAYVIRTIKFYLWAYGGYKIYVDSSAEIAELVQKTFSPTGQRAFDVSIMEKVYGRPFEVSVGASFPKKESVAVSVGGHLEGCRIGFDLGASDYKLAAVQDGEVLYTDEIPWDPVVQTDPGYHWERIQSGLEKAASYLPRVDCIGGSSAGIIQDNYVRVASLFRSIPAESFQSEVMPIFNKLQEKWKVPFVVANDGDVSALAGSMSLNENGILGLAMGSSEAVGFLDKGGKITGQLNELAFAPVDYGSQAAEDEWSKDIGLGVQYFSQQAVNKLALAAGFQFPEDMGLPIRLKEVQKKANENDPVALSIFETIGVYLGYTVPYYAQFYDFQKIMVFGRVTSGTGGDVIIAKAQEVLDSEFPGYKIALSVPDEKFRRVGQAVAAASLPELG